MSNITKHRKHLWNAARVCGIAWLLSGGPGLAQSVKVARDSLAFVPDAVKKELEVDFRLVEDVGIIPGQAATEDNQQRLPVTWEGWEGDNAPACAWMIVIDTSNLNRAKTVAKGVDEVRAFLKILPKQDKVALCTLALNLSEVLPFDSTTEAADKALKAIKPAGDASQTTLLFMNLRNGLGRLAERKEPRKAVLLLTDGKDESPGGVQEQQMEKTKLIEAAKKAGIVIHTLGYAESSSDQVHFASIKDISAQTDGIFRPAASDNSKKLPEGTLPLLCGVMHGAGTVRIDVSKLVAPAALTVTLKNAVGKEGILRVPREIVEVFFPPVIAQPSPTPTPTTTPPPVVDPPETKPPVVLPPIVPQKPDMVIWLVSGGVLLLLVIAMLLVRASRKRAAADARLAEEEQAAEDAWRAAETRRQADALNTVEAPPLAWLEMCDALQTRHPVRIPSLKIGRGQHNDLVLRNDSVSGNHCVLNRKREGEWSITDLNSGNGVVLNGESVLQAPLRHGDVIELGELKMRFLLLA